MKRICAAIGLSFAALSSSAHADVYAGYKGVPFNPTVGGGPNIPPGIKAGPYAIPGRVDIINYDMGGAGVGYQTLDHFAYGGAGYRVDGPAPTFSGGQTTTLCKTSAIEKDVWYQTGDATLDGTTYPSATTNDFYIGALHPNEWLNVTVNVMQSGTYSLSSAFSTGSGPMELQIYVNGSTTVAMDWKSTLAIPDYHHWKPFPNFGTIQLTAGVQVLKFELQSYHLNLDYIQFDLVGADGGIISSGSGSSSGTAAASGASSTGTSATSGTSSTSGTSATSGASSTSGTAATGSTAVSGSSTGTTAGSGTAASGTASASGTAAPSGVTSTSGSVTSGTTSPTSGTALQGGSGSSSGSVGATGGSAVGATPPSGESHSSGCSIGALPVGQGSFVALALAGAAGFFGRLRSRKKRQPGTSANR